jgi:transposase
MVLRVPSAFYKELADEMYEQYGVRLSESHVSKFFAKKGITVKKVQHILPCS